MRPVLKWAGNKSQLLEKIKKHMPKEYNKYFEAFLGGGSLFFYLMPEEAYINDKNSELMNVYESIRDNCNNLILQLQNHQKMNSEEYYYKVRNADRTPAFKNWGKAKKAARTIYLNKTCYGGLYRVNSKGEFNTPYARYDNPSIYNEKNLLEVSKYLKGNKIHIYSKDFNEFLNMAKKGDFVYLDPPYWSEDKQKMFTSYQKEGFDIFDQHRLKVTCDQLSKKGVYIMMSNALDPEIKKLYRKDYKIYTVTVERYIGNHWNASETTKELLICNYDCNDNILLQEQ